MGIIQDDLFMLFYSLLSPKNPSPPGSPVYAILILALAGRTIKSIIVKPTQIKPK
mgnify:CR=1 FL=1